MAATTGVRSTWLSPLGPAPAAPPLCWRSQAARARVVVCVVSHLDEDLHEGRLLYALLHPLPLSTTL